MARTTVTDVRDELDVDTATLSDADIQTEIDKATILVDTRISAHTSDSTALELVERHVAADYCVPRLTGEIQGQVTTSVERESSAISYETQGNSPHWEKAVELDPTGRLYAHHDSPTVV